MQNRKLENLKREYLASCIDPDKVMFNYSTYILNDVEKKVLLRGLKFSKRPDKLDYCEFLTPFEKLAMLRPGLKALPWLRIMGTILHSFLSTLVKRNYLLLRNYPEIRTS